MYLEKPVEIESILEEILRKGSYRKKIGTIKICHFVLEWESRFTLGLKIAKIADYTRKCFKQNLSKLNFLQKLLERTSLSPPGVELGTSKFCHF